MKLPYRVLIASPSLKLQGGVAHFIDLLFKTSALNDVEFTHVVVGKRSESSAVWKRPFEYLIEIGHFLFTFMQKRPDLVHLNPSLNYRSLPLSLFLFWIVRFLRQPVLIMFHGWDEEVAASMVIGTLRGRFLKKLLSGADHYLVLAQRFKEQLVQAGFPSRKISVISMMVESGCFAFDTHVRTQRMDEPLRVLFLSRLERDKGIWELLEAFEWWQQNLEDLQIHLTIAGDGSQKQAAEDWVVQKGWNSRIKFTGYVRGQDKLNLFKDAQVFVFPSHHQEGFPNAILEALAAGLPIIYTPVGACAEILGTQNGIRLEHSALSGEKLGRSIWELYGHPERRCAMSAANRKLAQDKFDVSVVCSKLIDIYRQAIGSANP